MTKAIALAIAKKADDFLPEHQRKQLTQNSLYGKVRHTFL